jgi:glycosyltransferase involved in cell wall biosynthesis
VDLSVVVPLYNEEDNFEALNREIFEACEPMGIDWEVVYVDDGSMDATFSLMQKAAAENSRVVGVSFRRNFGQTAAMAAGFDYAKGEVVVAMDGDLQNDPKDIPRMLDKLTEGYDIVAGWRYQPPGQVAQPQAAQQAGQLADQQAPPMLSCTTTAARLRLFGARWCRGIRLYGEMHRFIPAIASGMGVRIAEMKVNHRPHRGQDQVRHRPHPPGDP